jgi:hypothetical protein
MPIQSLTYETVIQQYLRIINVLTIILGACNKNT